MFGSIRRFHFIGVGGAGMSPLAELLARLGYSVTGSDLKLTETTAHLAELGVGVLEGHRAEHVGDAQAVVFSSAVRPTNPEYTEAAARGLPLVPRGELLAELMKSRYGIAVAGAHGKTTTTSMIALTLERGGLDPTVVIGGRLATFGGNARLGRGPYMVAETDESDRSFLRLAPVVSVVTNIDYEHLESYASFDELLDAFAAFANAAPFFGCVVACLDDPHVRQVIPRLKRRVITYALDAEDATYVGMRVRVEGFGGSCEVWKRSSGGAAREAPRARLGDVTLAVPGRHNLQNAIAAVAVGEEVGLEFSQVARALAEFRGVDRRFERRGEVGGVLVVDDYGHHPTEIRAVIGAARAAGARRVIVAFQPHRYSRTALLMAEFGPALADADAIVLTDIYSAGEDPLPGITIARLAQAVEVAAPGRVELVASLDAVPAALARLARRGDIVVTLGAGTIGSIADEVVDALRRKEGPR